MPVKVDTRKKTRKQKEKNRRRKKRNQSRRAQVTQPQVMQPQGPSLLQRLRRSLGLNQITGIGPKPPQDPGGSRTRRIRPSMQAIHGVVANAYASRMPVGSNHTKGIYANTETGLSTKNFFKRTLRQMKRAQNPDLPPTYSYQVRPQPIYPEEIHVQPIGLAEPSKAMSNLFKALPAASVPRGRRQSFLREAHAGPISTGLAEPGMPNWGQMYEATEEGRERVTRAMTADELRKEDNYMQVQADMRTGGPGPSMGIWAPTRVRTEDDGAAAANGSGSVSSRESARRDGRRRLSMVEEHAFLQYFPHERTDMLAAAKIPGPEGALARAEIRRLTNAVFSNSNSSINTESHASSLSSAGRADIERMGNLTPEEIERLRLLGLEHIAPGPEVQGYDRWTAISEIRGLLRNFNSNSNSVASSIHSQHSFDPLHLSGGEILLLRRQGPEGVEYIRRATTSADQEIVMDQVAEAREFLSRALAQPRSRSRSSSRSSNGSDSTGAMLREYQAMHAAVPQESVSTESSGTGPLESLSPLSSRGSRDSRGSTGSTSSRGSRGSRNSRRS